MEEPGVSRILSVKLTQDGNYEAQTQPESVEVNA